MLSFSFIVSSEKNHFFFMGSDPAVSYRVQMYVTACLEKISIFFYKAGFIPALKNMPSVTILMVIVNGITL